LDPERLFPLKATDLFGLTGQLAGGGDGHGRTSKESLTAGPQEGIALLRDRAKTPPPYFRRGQSQG
jgi:hypothetical protein